LLMPSIDDSSKVGMYHLVTVFVFIEENGTQYIGMVAIYMKCRHMQQQLAHLNF
jgi:hypothetical protein